MISSRTQFGVYGAIIFGAATALLAILGYKYIHALGRVATVVGLLAGFLFLTAIALGAGWQMTFGPATEGEKVSAQL